MPKRPADTAAASTSRRMPQSWSTERSEHRRAPYAFLTEDATVRERAVQIMVSDISRVLGEAIDELCTYSTEFRVALTKAVLHVLRRSMTRQESVLIFNEAIPGHTVMLFKKGPSSVEWQASSTPASSGPDSSQAGEAPLEDTPEAAAAGIVIDQFVRRTQHRVLVAEGDDALFVFFPVQDLRKNLRELGFYITE